jgi:isoleucyl-tRNA synthetase
MSETDAPRPPTSATPRAPRRRYPDVPVQPRFPEIEERVLAGWRKDDVFRRSVADRPAGAHGENEFVDHS